MATITKQQLLNASVDADDLAQVVNGDANLTVETRLGEEVDSLAKAINSIKSFVIRGDWETGVAYNVKDIFFYENLPYFTVLPHTSGVFATDLADGKFGIYQGVNFKANGSHSVYRGIVDKVKEVEVSLTDFETATTGPVVPNSNLNVTTALNFAVASLPSAGGRIKMPVGNYRINGVIDQDCITLEGGGGCLDYDAGVGFHGAFAKGLRPYDTGDGTTTLTIGTGSQFCRRVGLDNISISGDDGSGIAEALGNQAEVALKIGGGVSISSFSNLDLRDGIITLHMLPSNDLAVTSNYFDKFNFRNDTNTVNSRVLKVERSDDNSNGAYYTANHFINGHMNGPSNGYCIEVDAHDSPGINLQMVCVYCDIKPDCGILLNGNARIEAWDLTLDPGELGVPVVETTAPLGTRDITDYLFGFIKHGGQQLKYGGGEVLDIPAEAQLFLPNARIYNPFMSDLQYLTSAIAPFDKSRYWDWATFTGPMRLNGIDMRIMRTTQATDLNTAALQTEGGFSAKKDMRVGGDIYGYGGNASPAFVIAAAGSGGGVYLGALGTNQNVRLIPDGTGLVVVAGGGLAAAGTTQDVGQSGSGFRNYYATTAYYVGTTKVVGARVTGWTADTGTAKRTANASYVTGSTLTVGVAYSQAEVTAIITRLALVEAALQDSMQAQKAMKDDLIAHGLIGT